MKPQSAIFLRGIRWVMMILCVTIALAMITVVLMRNYGPRVSAEYNYGIRHRR
jgi:hypothetical protein